MKGVADAASDRLLDLFERLYQTNKTQRKGGFFLGKRHDLFISQRFFTSENMNYFSFAAERSSEYPFLLISKDHLRTAAETKRRGRPFVRLMVSQNSSEIKRAEFSA